jgi:hypothetical protein
MNNIFLRVKDENGVEHLFNMAFSNISVFKDYQDDKEPNVYKVYSGHDVFKISKDTYQDIMRSLKHSPSTDYIDLVFNKD